ncbi:unnamed protein product [Debaryomyces tyrocola]|nr:unnamed protein product [Debaryomyces tyrocola]
MPPKKSKNDSKVSKIDSKHLKKFKFPDNFNNLLVNYSKQFFKPQPETLIRDQIIIVEKFFSNELCNELIKSFESSPELKMETTPLIKSKEYAARFNDRGFSVDFDASRNLWSYLQKILLQEFEYEDDDGNDMKLIFNDAIALNSQLRIYRYRKGHHFGQHYDESVICPLAEDKSNQKGITKWTLLIYLTGDDEFKGGGTIFYPDYSSAKHLNVHPSKGMALLHKHGDDCLKHEAEIVEDGVKWVLRSDVVYPL